MSEGPTQSRAAAAAAGAQQGKKSSRATLLGGAAALFIAGAAAIGFMHHGAGAPHLRPVPQSEIAALAPTLDPAQAPQIIAQAKTCQVPLTAALIYHDAGAPDSVVRIQSGSYTSPPVTITSTPSWVAIPYPTPYATGAGNLTLLGNAQHVEFLYRSTLAIPSVNGSDTVPAVWDTGNPCP